MQWRTWSGTRWTTTFCGHLVHLFLCSVAPTAPAAQPAVSLATVYGCKGCAAGLVFMCVSRASLACCDCYPQRLFGKLGAATAVSGFRAKELDPIIGVATHGSPGNRSDDSRRHTCGQRENIDVHGRLQRKRDGREPTMATSRDSSGIHLREFSLKKHLLSWV